MIARICSIVLILAAVTATADADMRCGSRLISEGDSREKLFHECGPPTSIESWDEEEYDYLGPRRGPMGYGARPSIVEVVRVEVWTYNYGPNRFIDYVRIENGRIRSFDSGSYGR